MTCRRDVVEAVHEVCGIAENALSDDATLESMGIDSLDIIEIAMIIEQRHHVVVNGDDFDGVSTFGEAVATFDRLIDPST